MDTKEIECCIRGYHVYRDIWEAAVDEELVCRPERSNAHDRYAVAVMKNDLVDSDRGPAGSRRSRCTI